MIRAVLLSTAAVLLTAAPALAQDEAAARRILEGTPLIDGHNDLPWALRQQHGNDPYAVDLTANLDASTARMTRRTFSPASLRISASVQPSAISAASRRG